MKKFIVAMAAAFALFTGVLPARAQTSLGPKDLGFAYAVDYSKWVLRSNGSISSGAQIVTIRGNALLATIGGESFIPLATNAPLLIDAENSSVSETVTPTAVTCSFNSLENTCTFSATFSNAHTGNFSIKSGTSGVCEALNSILNAASGGTVVIANGWSGATADITNTLKVSACVSTTVNLLDVRAGLFQFYVKGGSVFTTSISPVSGATVPDATVATAVGTPFYFDAQVTTTNWNEVISATGANTAAARFAGLKTRATSNTAPATTTVVTGDDLLEIAAFGADGTNYINTAGILFDSTGTVAATRVPSVIKFFTGTDAAPTVKTLALTLGADQSSTFVAQMNVPTINNTAGALALKTTTSGNITLQPAAAATAAVTTTVRHEMAQGATVVSASCSSGDCTFGGDGNLFLVSGTTAVDGFATAGWQSGSMIIVHTDNIVTFNNAGTVAGGFAQMLLVGGANVSMTANDYMMLVYDGTAWNQIAPTLVK